MKQNDYSQSRSNGPDARVIISPVKPDQWGAASIIFPAALFSGMILVEITYIDYYLILILITPVIALILFGWAVCATGIRRKASILTALAMTVASPFVAASLGPFLRDGVVWVTLGRYDAVIAARTHNDEPIRIVLAYDGMYVTDPKGFNGTSEYIIYDSTDAASRDDRIMADITQGNNHATMTCGENGPCAMPRIHRVAHLGSHYYRVVTDDFTSLSALRRRDPTTGHWR